MNIVKADQANKISPSPSATIFEYLMDEKNISGAVAEIRGRYPETGCAVNEACKEIAFIIHGTGMIVTEKLKQSCVVGDVIFIDIGEQFYWKGNFSVFMVTTPKFSAKQHKVIQ